MRRIDALPAEYGESRQTPVNKRAHGVCVPVIFTCVMALVWSLPSPFGVNLLWPAAALALLYYLALSPRLAAGFVLVWIGPAWLLSFVYHRLGLAW